MSAPLHFEPAVGTPLCWFTAAIRVGAALDPPGLEGMTRHAAELARRGAGGLDARRARRRSTARRRARGRGRPRLARRCAAPASSATSTARSRWPRRCWPIRC